MESKLLTYSASGLQESGGFKVAGCKFLSTPLSNLLDQRKSSLAYSTASVYTRGIVDVDSLVLIDVTEQDVHFIRLSFRC